MNLDSFLNSMKERNSKRLDLIAPTNLLTLDYSTDQGSYVLGANMNNDSKEFKVNHNTKRQICDKMGLPAKYWDYLEKQGYEDLAINNINYLFKNGSENNTVRSVNGVATAFLSDRYETIDNDFVAGAVIDRIADDYRNENLNIIGADETDKKLYMKLTKPSVNAEIAKGDIVEAGVIISNSETGHGAINVNPFINRLVCLNGMTVNDARFKAVHLAGAKEEGIINTLVTNETKQKKLDWLHSQIGDVVENSLKHSVFQQSVSKITDATAEKIKPTEAIEIISDKYQLTKDEETSIFDSLARRDSADIGEPSKWSLINAVTDTAKRVDSVDRRNELEAIGGKILALVIPKPARLTA